MSNGFIYYFSQKLYGNESQELLKHMVNILRQQSYENLPDSVKNIINLNDILVYQEPFKIYTRFGITNEENYGYYEDVIHQEPMIESLLINVFEGGQNELEKN